MDKKILYTKAYEMLNNRTPLRTDCGTLCDKACCQNHEEDSGMYLFPGEEIMYEQHPDFLSIRSSGFQTVNGDTVQLAVCSGSCNRNLRPLSCRIFPLTPYITDNDILMIKMDPRAAHLCPIARYSDRKKLNQDFVKSVRSAFQMLIDYHDIKDYIVKLSRMLDDYEQSAFFKLSKY